MPSADDRIVKIEFDNSAFENRISETLNSLSELDDALAQIGSQNALANLSVEAGNSNLTGNLGGITEAVSNISEKFSSLGVIGFTVIQNLTNAALGFVAKIGSDIIDPIFSGGLTRAKNIEQAKFMFEGLGIDITAGMQSALDAVKGTAFGLDEAAKAAAQFGASGIQVGDQMTSALRGVAGAAALTGRSFTEIADIFAGSAGTGIVNNLDLQQFATRGLNAASAVAKVMGITEQQVHDLASSGKLDFATFASAMDQAFGAHATEANKTFTGSLANMHAALSRLGAAIIAPELTNFRDVFNATTPVIDNFTAAFQPLIDTFSSVASAIKGSAIEQLNGISFASLKLSIPGLQEGLINIYFGLSNIFKIGKEAFDAIFPDAGKQLLLVRLVEAFRQLTQHLILTEEGANKLRTIFEGVFSVLAIGWEIVKQGVGFLLNLGKALLKIFGGDVSNGVQKLSGGLIGLKESLVDNGGIKNFFDGFARFLQKPLSLLKDFRDAIGKVFDFFKNGLPENFSVDMGRVGDRVGMIRDAIASVLGVISDPLQHAFIKITDILGKIIDKVSDWVHTFAQKVAEMFQNSDFSPVTDALNTGLLISIAVLLKKFIDNGLKIFVKGTFDIAGGVLERLSRGLDQLTGTLTALQTNLKANALLKIAIAIGILAASLLVLSLIDSVALSKALAAMAVGFAELMGSFAVFTKLITGPKAAASFALTAGGLILLAGAMIVLSIAAKILSTIDWDGIAKGMVGIAGGLGSMIAAMRLMPKDGPFIRAGIGLLLMATSLVILAEAMKIFASMDWESLAKGLVGTAVGLGAMVAAMNLMPEGLSLVKAGASLLLIAVAMNILAGAMKIFATMKWKEMAKGLVGIGGGLLLIVLAMNVMPEKELIARAAAIAIVSKSLVVLAVALKLMAGLSWDEIARGLVVLGASLLIIAGALFLMEGTLPGAAALAIVASALVLLAGVLKVLGAMSIGDIVKGLVTIAVAMLVIAGLSDLLSESIPAIAAFGAAMLLLGAGFALAGLGIYAVSKAFEVFVRVSKDAAQALPVFLEVLSKSVAAFVKGLAEGVIDSIKPLLKAAPIFAKLIGKLVSLLLDEIIKLAPKMAHAIQILIEQLFKIIRSYASEYIDAGIFIIEHFLKGIANNIDEIVHIVAKIITKFLDAMTDEIPRITDSVVNTITTAMTSASEALGEIAATLMFGLAVAFMEGFLNGLQNAFSGPVADFFIGIASAVLGFIGDLLGTLFQKGVDIITGLWNGISNFIGTVSAFFINLGGSIFGWVGALIGTLVSAGQDVIQGLFNGIVTIWNNVTGFLGGIGSGIISAIGSLHGLLRDIGEDVMNGLWNGLKEVWDKVKDFLSDVADKIASTFEDALDIFSPSRRMKKIGVYTMLGLHIGMKDTWKNTQKWLESINIADTMDQTLGDGMSKVLGRVAEQMGNMDEFQPTITPVLDLTQVQRDASNIRGMIDDGTLTPFASSANARHIARMKNPHHDKQTDPQIGHTSKDVTFEQNIYAPTRMSAAEMYKQTRGQFVLAKEELEVP